MFNHSKEIQKNSTGRLSFLGRLNEIKVGPLSLPYFLIASVIIIIAVYMDELPTDVMGGMGVLLVLGWSLGKIGSTIPILNKLGGATILSMLIPAIFVLFHLIPDNALNSVEFLMSDADFLDIYVFSLITGSILGMNTKVLINGFARMVIPMIVGFVLAVLIPSTLGWILGLGFQHTLFYIVGPTLAGGIGGGILPLALGYSHITSIPYGEVVATLAPATIIGNFFAIIIAALINRLGEKKPELNGNGTLIKAGKGLELDSDDKKVSIPISFGIIGAGFFLVTTLYIGGTMAATLIGLPAAVIIIFASTLLKYFSVLPSSLESGVLQLNKLISANFTYPLMVGLGIIYLSLEDVLKIMSWQYVLIILVTVLTLGATGFFLANYVHLYPIESAIISLNQASMGGTGNVAILSTANRQEMMPFAQVATRIGGAITITFMISLLRFIF
ncbi:2-hydroxycarboxylate transporter family protein [Marinilactibacillus sp. Marseille-P9653]|uniref:2-hydroxycarboxylate transporter family protein n=1 Tax=Marinilactibacillus sp. Marseille-P9653 TaxID=2866583 RepID=UPI001CE4804D|nr:2-hydroxycarboxylate transporter family protein [Marinilactibacillus sp. Marseille-P9653]